MERNVQKFILILMIVMLGLVNCTKETGTDKATNGTVRYCDFPNYVPENGCNFPLPNFSNRFNYTGICVNGQWEIEGNVYAEPKRNITICGSNVKINGILVVPSTSSLLILQDAKVSAECVFLYGDIHLHYADRPLDNVAISINNVLEYNNCADFFTTKIHLYLDNTTIPCQTISITNTTTNASFSFEHIGKNQCKADYKVFVIIVSVLGAAILVAVFIYIIISIYQECCAPPGEEEEDD
eukprot:TRINITY_DN112_c2_g1_i1.p1 TRINITY_DN112_c2_g1~~TRINITY_DN112_c2_g1_i1.p1  ORF type:complete len:240 (+),score=62.43 TRINITY_DN112_c2_g1_i1:116-835(+)